MIRFAVVLFFFIHLAILLKAERFAFIGRITGWGTCLLFLYLYISPVEENSDLVFVLCAILTGISMLGAELVAKLLKKNQA